MADVNPMERFPVPDLEDVPEDVRERIEEEADQAGFEPNVFLAYAYKPSHFRAFFQYYDALTQDTDLSKMEIEMIIVATSGVNNCYYCIVAHGALLRLYSEQPELADQIAANHRIADISDKHRTMLDLVVKLTRRPHEVTSDDIQTLEDVGYSEEEIWDIASVTAFFNLSNIMALFTDMRPNDEFHTLGR